MKEQIQLLIAQHKLLKQEAEIELRDTFDYKAISLSKEIELRHLFIQELQELIY